MAIVHARIDNRLVHGQILSAWVPALRADALVVLDDAAFQSELVRSAMEIAIPPGVTFDVAPVAKAAEALARLPKSAKAVVLVRDVADAARIDASKAGIERWTLGNVHHAAGRRPLSQAVFLSEGELSELERLAANGVGVELKTLPRDASVSLPDVRARFEAAATA
jgi:mannose/fructose/N-acetylgalactosamine-specific phosphotransferase system component IIB